MTVEHSNEKFRSTKHKTEVKAVCSSYKLGVFQPEEKKENPWFTDHGNKSEVCG